MLFVCHPKILHKHCFQFLLGSFKLPRETAVWYVMVFSGMVAAYNNKILNFTDQPLTSQCQCTTSCFAFNKTLALPTCFCTFAPPRNFHATREKISSSGGKLVSFAAVIRVVTQRSSPTSGE